MYSECLGLGLFDEVSFFFVVLVGFTLGWLFANKKVDLEKEHMKL